MRIAFLISVFITLKEYLYSKRVTRTNRIQQSKPKKNFPRDRKGKPGDLSRSVRCTIAIIFMTD